MPKLNRISTWSIDGSVCVCVIEPCTHVMAAPVRPPMRDTALLALVAILPTALPAELVTLVSPC